MTPELAKMYNDSLDSGGQIGIDIVDGPQTHYWMYDKDGRIVILGPIEELGAGWAGP